MLTAAVITARQKNSCEFGHETCYILIPHLNECCSSGLDGVSQSGNDEFYSQVIKAHTCTLISQAKDVSENTVYG